MEVVIKGLFASLEAFVRGLGIPEGWAFPVGIFLVVWFVSWTFLPFSVWSISSKLGSIRDDLSTTKDAVRKSVEGLERLKERIEGLNSKLDRIASELADKKRPT